MRKCPNCKNPLPVGARRCVHCRALVGDSVHEGERNSSTQMGVGSGYASDVGHASSTSLGLPGAQALSRNLEDERRYPSNRSFEEAPHQTMIGLGPVMSHSRRRIDAYEDTMGGFSGQRTISGMPGISGMSPTQVSREEFSFVDSARDDILRERVNFKSVDEQASSQASRRYEADVWEVVARESERELVAEPVSIQKADSASGAELVQSPGEEDDPFAGLPGVAPKPSSLVDEEFLDLTSKLFGDDFATGTSGVDDEEDGWDFDFESVSVSKADVPSGALGGDSEVQVLEREAEVLRAVSEESSAHVDLDIEEDAKGALSDKSAESEKGVATATKTESASSSVIQSVAISAAEKEKASVLDNKPAVTEGGEVDHEGKSRGGYDVETRADDSSSADNSTLDFMLKCGAAAALLILMIWCATAFQSGVWSSGSGGMVVVVTAIFSIVADLVFFLLNGKVKGLGTSGILFIASIVVLSGALYASKMVEFNLVLLVIALLLQLSTAIAALFKK